MPTILPVLVLTTLLQAPPGAGANQGIEEAAVDPEQSVRQSLNAFIDAWNTADNEQLRRTLHFPFVSLGIGGAIDIASRPEELATDFEDLRQRQGWVRSAFDFDSLETVHLSPGKAHCAIDFERTDRAGTVYMRGRVLYVVVERDGRWGLQMRTGVSRPASGAAAEAALDAARRTVLDFFTAFNSADVEGATRMLNYPHIFLGSGGWASVADDADAASVRPGFEAMRAEQGWHMSTLDSIAASHIGADRVHFDIVFSRWRIDGTRYLTIPALWIVTRAGDHWGIQLRSLLPPTFSR